MSTSTNVNKPEYWKIPIHIMFSLITVVMVIPLIMLISNSFSEEAKLVAVGHGGGFSILPQGFSLDAYRLVFRNPESILKAYGVTTLSSVVGTVMVMSSAGMCAYPLSRGNFKYKGFVQKYLLITMLFSAGTIPTYIVYTRYYHLGDSIWIYILPNIAGGAWTIFMFRTYIRSLSEALYESAEIDGASELYIFFRIVVPLAVPMIAAQSFLSLVGRWSDWGTSLLYIRNPDLYTLQYLLQRVLSQEEFMKGLAQNPVPGIDMRASTAPTETLRYAMVVICAGPMLVIFPFFQKYFSKGLTIGSVKGGCEEILLRRFPHEEDSGCPDAGAGSAGYLHSCLLRRRAGARHAECVGGRLQAEGF